MMDGSHIRAHQHSAGAAAHSDEDDHAIGISRGGTTSKIHLIVDACGNPLEVIITAGNVNDVSIIRFGPSRRSAVGMMTVLVTGV